MILVTGASGFLGQHLVRYLSSQGLQVRALYHTYLPGMAMQALPGISWVQCDMLDVYALDDVMNDITDVYHCAAIVSFNPKRRDEMLHFNVESTANMINLSLQKGVRKLVYISSVAALGRKEYKGKEINEETEWDENSKYNSAYGLSKYLAEMEVWRGIGEGLDALIVNPGIIFGEDDRGDGATELLKLAYKEFPFYTQGVTAWADVQDVVRILHMMMQSDVSGERFILSSGNMAYKDVFAIMAKAMGKKPPHLKATTFMTGILWRYNALKRSLGASKNIITKETAANAQNLSYYNNTKLLEFFPAFTYTPMEDTINRVAAAFVKNYGKN